MRRALAGGCVVLCLASCLQLDVYRCEGSSACGQGVCEPEGYCAYPDTECPQGRRWSERAGEGLAGQCVEPQSASGTTDDPGSSTDSPDAEAGDGALCGNAIVDAGEDCDDGNSQDGDGCNADCRASGSTQWTMTIASEAGTDAGRAVVFLGGGDIVVGGEVGQGINWPRYALGPRRSRRRPRAVALDIRRRRGGGRRDLGAWPQRGRRNRRRRADHPKRR